MYNKTNKNTNAVYPLGLICIITIIAFVSLLYRNVPVEAAAPTDIIITTDKGELNSFQTLLLNNLGVNNLEVIFDKNSNNYIYTGQLSFSGNLTTYQDRLNEISRLPFIYKAEYDEVLETQVTSFNDPYFNSQWSLKYIEAPKAFNLLDKKPGAGTIVAVIDTGIEYTHSDIKNNIWTNEAEANGTEGVDDDGNGYIDDIYGYNFLSSNSSNDPMDDATDSHGTHVAGIIAMEANNNIFGTGVAYSSKVMALKAGDYEGHFSTSNVIKAVKYAVDKHADVINLSLGSNKYTSSISALGICLEEASHSCVIVAAAGNEYTPTSEAADNGYTGISADTYPAVFPYVIGVMSCDSESKLSTFSNWDYVNGSDKDYDIIAPGTKIYSLRRDNRIYSMSGTSMATPLVAGAAADIISYYKSLGLSYSTDLIKEQLVRSTSNTVTYTDTINVDHTFKSLNLYDAINKLPVPVLNLTQNSFYNSNNDELLTSSGMFYSDNAIAFDFSLYNEFVQAKNITVKLECANPETYSYINFINQSVNIENMDYKTSYTSNYDDEGSIRFKINENFPAEGGTLSFIVTITAENGWNNSDVKEYSFVTYCSCDINEFTAGSETSPAASPTVTPTIDPTASPTAQPSSTIVPLASATPEPGDPPYITESPAPYPTPGITSAPRTSERPVSSTIPEPSADPDASASPVSSNSPEPSTIPAYTPSPEPSIYPACTSTPTATFEPEVTSFPITSPSPNITVVPTSAPIPTSSSSNVPTVTQQPLPATTDSSAATPWYSQLSVYSTRNILYYGGNYANTAYIALAGVPSGYSLSYTSANTKILKVSKYGKLTAMGVGTATISTVLTNNSTGDQYIYLSKIVVKKASVSFSKSKLKLIKGRKYICKVTVKGIKKGSIRFFTSSKKIASVNRLTGQIKALFKGNAKITAKFGSIKRKLSVTVTVKK